jgi:hypothetical protein
MTWIITSLILPVADFFQPVHRLLLGKKRQIKQWSFCKEKETRFAFELALNGDGAAQG